MVAKFINLFKPAVFLHPISDKSRIDHLYKHWRLRIFCSMYLGYVFFYFTRKSIAFISPALSTELGLSNSQIGLLGTILSLSYGVSKFVSGVLCDRSNPRYFMAFGLIATGVCNIIFGMSSHMVLFWILCGMNGLFQGWGWPSCTKQLTHWFSSKERGVWWSIASTSNNLGGFTIAYLASYCATYFGWRYGMFVPGVLAIFMGISLIINLRDVPRSLGLPTIEEYHVEEVKAATLEKKVLPIRQILIGQVLNNKYIWLLSFAYFFVYVVRSAINDFGTLYLVQTKGYSPVDAAACISLFEVGGFIGILTTGWCSDKLFAGKRIPMILLCALGMIFAILGLEYFSYADSIKIGVVGVLTFGPQMLVGLAAAEVVDKKAASTANGFVGAWAYFGAACAGYPLGLVTEIWGWDGFIITLAICSGILALILLPLLVEKK